MIPEFINLTEDEQRQLINAPALISILIAGSDNKIDKVEKEWAEKVAHFRSLKTDSLLSSYYQEVDKYFKETFNEFVDSLPEDSLERGKEIFVKLGKLNTILPKLDKDYASALYQSFLTYAEQVAKSSGGILGYAAVSPEEEELMKLSMITEPS